MVMVDILPVGCVYVMLDIYKCNVRLINMESVENLFFNSEHKLSSKTYRPLSAPFKYLVGSTQMFPTGSTRNMFNSRYVQIRQKLGHKGNEIQ